MTKRVDIALDLRPVVEAVFPRHDKLGVSHRETGGSRSGGSGSLVGGVIVQHPVDGGGVASCVRLAQRLSAVGEQRETRTRRQGCRGMVGHGTTTFPGDPHVRFGRAERWLMYNDTGWGSFPCRGQEAPRCALSTTVFASR